MSLYILYLKSSCCSDHLSLLRGRCSLSDSSDTDVMCVTWFLQFPASEVQLSSVWVRQSPLCLVLCDLVGSCVVRGGCRWARPNKELNAALCSDCRYLTFPTFLCAWGKYNTGTATTLLQTVRSLKPPPWDRLGKQRAKTLHNLCIL